jgi:hypothetical protein
MTIAAGVGTRRLLRPRPSPAITARGKRGSLPLFKAQRDASVICAPNEHRHAESGVGVD